LSEAKDRLISFASVHHAIKAEKLLTEAGVAVTALPTPREISISCGQCLLLAAKDQQQALAVLVQADVLWSKLYSRDQKQRVYELLSEYGRNL
jgi:hypothetical protein